MQPDPRNLRRVQWLPPLRLQVWLTPPPATLSEDSRRRLEQAHNRRRALTAVATAGLVALLVGGSVPGVAGETTVAAASTGTASATVSLGGASGLLPQVPQYAMVPSAAGKDGLLLPGQVVEPALVASAVTDLGIPAVALDAYESAATTLAAADPGCRIDWTLIAGIGRVESDHGRYGGRAPATDGTVTPPILGIPLDGRPGVALIRDTDGGRLDGDTVFDRAVGPMQFIPGTWAGFADADGDGNGSADPHNLYDAALATALYLCAGSGDLSTLPDQRSAVFRYNQSNAYVDTVLAYAGAYAAGVEPTGPAPTPDEDTPVVPVVPIVPTPGPTTGPTSPSGTPTPSGTPEPTTGTPTPTDGSPTPTDGTPTPTDGSPTPTPTEPTPTDGTPTPTDGTPTPTDGTPTPTEPTPTPTDGTPTPTDGTPTPTDIAPTSAPETGDPGDPGDPSLTP